jgi:PilZ domain
MGGMQVEVSDLKPKDSVRVSFRLPPSGALIDAVGIVVWAKETWQGIQFTKVNEQSQLSIRQFMTEVENLDR